MHPLHEGKKLEQPRCSSVHKGVERVLPIPNGLLLSLEEKGRQSFMIILEQLDSNMPSDTGPEDRPSVSSLLSGIESNRTQKQRGEQWLQKWCLSGRGCGS